MEKLVAGATTTTARPAAPGRVCLIVGRLGRGAPEQQLLLLAAGLQRHRVEVRVVVLAGADPDGDPLSGAGIPVVHLGLRRTRAWRQVPALLAAAARLAGQLRRSRPDVVHAFHPHACVLAAPLARLVRVPVIVAGRPGRADPERGHRLLRAAGRIATRMTDLIVANAQAVADRVRDREGVPAGKVTVIYQGVAPTAFATVAPARVVSPHPIVLCAGGQGAPAHLLHAVALLRARGLACTLLLAQDGPERPRLRQRVAELGIDVRLPGPRADLRRLLARADAVFLPATADGLSPAALAALAAGRPVVAMAAGGLPELLGGGRGVLVRPDDPVELADALAGVLTDPDRADRLGRAARDWSEIHLHADAMVRRHLALYAELGARRTAV